MKFDINTVASFIGRWLAIGACLHFGLKIGTWLDSIIPWGP